DTDTIEVLTGWNLIGSVTRIIPTTNVSSIPLNIIGPSIYSYDSRGYTPVDSLRPFRGFWVKANQNGKVILSSIGLAKNISTNPLMIDFNKLNTIYIENGRISQALFFGPSPEIESITSDYELPPKPPQPIFDARFASQHFTEFYPSTLVEKVSFPLMVQSDLYPISIQWKIINNPNIRFSISEQLNDEIVGIYTLSDSGTVTMRNPRITNLRLHIEPVNDLPMSFSLSQNYPNPFNPRTNFEFTLPKAGLVTLLIYNVLGQEVAKVLNEVKQPGKYIVNWDASKLSSGLYFYRLTSGEYATARKMIILK
ncbi:MAG TPA: T9SS type A sorting domain-containing protein, partial [Bacteroidota bacterium]|nr:T9SS type A sorting domain-containing protein [Bacteroidota bacterium]